MKKGLTTILVLILAFSLLVGCSTTEEPKTEETKNETTKTEEKKDDVKKEEAEPVAVEFWHGYSTDKAEVLDELVAKYNAENDEVNVTAKFVASGEEMLQKVQAAIMADEQPDILWGYPTWTGVLESTGKLVNVEGLMDDAYIADIPEGLLNAGKFNDTIYSVPIEAGTLYFIYNKDMFEEAGITEVPTTWEELYAIAPQLTTDTHQAIWLPIEVGERTTWTWECFLWQNGGDILNDNNTAVGFDRENGLEALAYYSQFIKDGYAPITVGQDPFIEEQVAIIIGTQGAANAYINKYEMNVGVAMLPGKEQLATGLGSNHYFLFNNGEEATVDAAFDFVKWMTTGENHAEWAIRSGYLPVANSARESEKYVQFGEENPHMIVAAEALTHGVARPPIEEYPQISDLISTTIEAIAYDQMTPEEGIDHIIESTNDILK
ncbi:ABC transporter substrate-binding protein [Vallitalea okinawensis]|uniref:ABC transporter substrate-binding protein n=1 Tax=Vallitalea okinawensis TaxID=2078660 RepID=UPI000CFCBB3D|nr:ABC transporter substrate-binding protein [Vallitalea okinawensis]